MDSSSAWQLMLLVNKVVYLNNWYSDGKPDFSIVEPCQEIRDVFHGVNEELFQSWNIVMEFCDKTTTAISNELRGLNDVICKFCDDTYTNEGEVKIATTAANDKAEELLGQLGL